MRHFNLLQSNLFDDFFSPVAWEAPRKSLSDIRFKETDEGYQLNVDLPGVKKEDADIEFKEGILTIKAKRENEFEEEGFHEKSSSSFSRSIKLPRDVDSKGLVAKLEHGVLKLEIAKTEESRNGHKVTVS